MLRRRGPLQDVAFFAVARRCSAARRRSPASLLCFASGCLRLPPPACATVHVRVRQRDRESEQKLRSWVRARATRIGLDGLLYGLWAIWVVVKRGCSKSLVFTCIQGNTPSAANASSLPLIEPPCPHTRDALAHLAATSLFDAPPLHNSLPVWGRPPADCCEL
jgi:hypothetical protein